MVDFGFIKNKDTDSLYHPVWGNLLKTSDVGSMLLLIWYQFSYVKVVRAFESLMLTGQSGQFMMVCPGVNFYWPNNSLEIFKILEKAAIIWTKLGGAAPVQPRQILLVFILTLLIFALFFHIVLSMIGL